MIEEFKARVNANPNARFTLKEQGQKLEEKNDIIYEKGNKFYQLFMEKPFLVRVA